MSVKCFDGRYQAIDNELFALAVVLRPLHYLNPVNVVEEKRAWLASAKSEPDFKYMELSYDPAEVARRIDRLCIPAGPFELWYRNKQEKLRSAHAVNLKRGDADFVRSVTSAEFGRPDDATVAFAKKILTLPPISAPVLHVRACIVKDSLADELTRSRLDHWRVEFGISPQTTVYTAEHKISICKSRMYASGDAKRLAVHEIGVHVLRSVNGESQPCRLFSLGIPGYLATEEGLAAYSEELTGCLDTTTMRNYAGRVLAVNAVHCGLTFRQTYDLLRSLDFDQDSAWVLCLRVFRGGGYLKDHVYLQGYLQVRGFAEKGGDLASLYVGKIGLKDLPKVEELLGKGLLNPPMRLPKWLEGGNAIH